MMKFPPLSASLCEKKEVKDMCLLLGVHEGYIIGEVQTGLYMG